jgi:hypothetical protein
MRAAAVVFVVAAAFAWLAVRGTLHLGSRPPSESAIPVRTYSSGAADRSMPKDDRKVGVRRRVEQVRIERYRGAGRP